MNTRRPASRTALGLLALAGGLSLTGSLGMTGIRPAHALSKAPTQSISLAALTARLDAQQSSLQSLRSTLSTLTTRVSTLQSTVTHQAVALRSQAATIQTLRQTNTALNAHAAPATTSDTTYGPFTVSGSDVYLNGYNLHIQNGAGKTGSANGLGNLIIGYNEVRTNIVHTGSHNLVVGQYQTYTSYGGIVGGYDNSITGPWASAIGGDANVASGTCSSVIGGFKNTASGNYASVLGSQSKTASAQFGLEPVSTSIASLQTQLTNQNKITSLFTLSNGVGTNTELTLTGKNLHLVDGSGSTYHNGAAPTGLGNLIVGYNETRASIGNSGDVRTGSHNIITGQFNNYSSYGGMVGGYDNEISGAAAFCMGASNTASGLYSSVSGGEGNAAIARYASVSGGAGSTANGYYSSVSGGYDQVTSNAYGWAAGSEGSNGYSGNFSSP